MAFEENTLPLRRSELRAFLIWKSGERRVFLDAFGRRRRLKERYKWKWRVFADYQDMQLPWHLHRPLSASSQKHRAYRQ